MRELGSWTRKASMAGCAGLSLLLAALGMRPAAAQTNMSAAIAVSPSTQTSGDSYADLSQADAERVALQHCQEGGHSDCRIVGSISGGCVALAIRLKPNYDGSGTGPTREAATTQALAACTKEGAGGNYCWLQVAPCSNDDPRWISPLPLPSAGRPGVPPRTVDPALVGLWKLNVDSGIWVWQIAANGFYTFHSEAPDKTPSHNGIFAASNGKYTLDSMSMNWDDQGTYTMQGPGVMVGVGKLGKGTWYKIASDPGYAEATSKPASGTAPQPGTRH